MKNRAIVFLTTIFVTGVVYAGGDRVSFDTFEDLYPLSGSATRPESSIQMHAFPKPLNEVTQLKPIAKIGSSIESTGQTDSDRVSFDDFEDIYSPSGSATSRERSMQTNVNEGIQLKPIAKKRSSCPVCLNKNIKFSKMQTLRCVHMICKTCYQQMQTEYLKAPNNSYLNSCPICRTPFELPVQDPETILAPLYKCCYGCCNCDQ